MMKNNVVDMSIAMIKRTITIDRRQLWNNYVECWTNMVGDYDTVADAINELAIVADALWNGPMDDRINRLFMDCQTVALMGNDMQFIDLRSSEFRNTYLFEIVVVDGDQRLIVSHDEICY